MKRFKKLALTAAALAALAVGGSAFAQAQATKTVTQTPVQRQRVEPSKPGDPVDGQNAEGEDHGPDKGPIVEEGADD